MVASHLIGLGHRHVAYISTGLNSEHSSRVNRCTGLAEEYGRSCPEGSVTVYSRDVSPERELNVVEIEHSVGYALAQDAEKIPRDNRHGGDQMTWWPTACGMPFGRPKENPGRYQPLRVDNIYPSGFHGVELTTVEHSIVERGEAASAFGGKAAGTAWLSRGRQRRHPRGVPEPSGGTGFILVLPVPGKHIAEQIGADKSSQGRKIREIKRGINQVRAAAAM